MNKDRGFENVCLYLDRIRFLRTKLLTSSFVVRLEVKFYIFFRIVDTNKVRVHVSMNFELNFVNWIILDYCENYPEK